MCFVDKKLIEKYGKQWALEAQKHNVSNHVSLFCGRVIEILNEFSKVESEQPDLLDDPSTCFDFMQRIRTANRAMWSRINRLEDI